MNDKRPRSNPTGGDARPSRPMNGHHTMPPGKARQDQPVEFISPEEFFERYGEADIALF